MTTGIYKIEHRASGKVYVGSSIDIDKRLRQHRGALVSGSHHSGYLQRAWNRHGPEAFSFTPIIICSPADRQMYEQRAIDGFVAAVRATGYNSAAASTGPLGVKRSAATRAKQRAARLGKAPWNKGVPMSEETRAKVSAAKKGTRPSEATLERLRGRVPWNKGRRGNVHSATTRARMSVSQRSVYASTDLRERLSAIHRRLWADPSYRARRGLA